MSTRADARLRRRDDGLDARQHLLGVAGLGDPVVGAGAQPAHPLGDARAAGADHHAQPGQGGRTRARGTPTPPGPSSARSTTSAFTRMATNSSTGGARLEAPVLPAEIARPLHQHSHEPRVRVEDRESQIRHRPSKSTGRPSGAAGFHSFSQRGNAGITEFRMLAFRGMEADSRPSAPCGELEIRPGRVPGARERRALHLTVRELDLLTALAERRDRIVTREELYRGGVGRALPQVRPLRGRVHGQAAPEARRGAFPGRRYIHTHFGFGYRSPPGPSASPSHPFYKSATRR